MPHRNVYTGKDARYDNIRFDSVYYLHFKCNLRRLVDYPNLWAYARDLYQQPGFGDTVTFDHIRRTSS